MSEKIEVYITGDSQGFDAAAARAAQQASKLEAALGRAESAKNSSAAAAAKAAGSNENLASAQKMAAETANKVSSSISGSTSKLDEFRSAVKLAWAAAAAGAAAAGLSAVKASAQMEQLQIAFTTMLGSAEKAKDLLGQLQDFAQRTPFDMESVVNGSRRLLAMGYSAEQILPVMTAVGDAAAGLGLQSEGINRITLAMGQMAAKGKVSAEEIRQLAEAGIPAWKFIADTLGITIPEAMKRAENNQISAAEGLTAIVAGMQSKFGGMMEAQSHTIAGMWSNLVDSIQRTSISVGDELVEVFDLHNRLASAMGFFDDFRARVDDSGLRSAIIASVPVEVVAAAFASIAVSVATVLWPAIQSAIAAFRALRVAMLSTPIGAAATAAAALGTAVYAKAQQYELGGQEREDLLQGVFDAEGAEGYESAVAAASKGVEKSVGDWRQIEESAANTAKSAAAANKALDFSNLGSFSGAPAGGGSSGSGSAKKERDTSAQEAKAYLDIYDKALQKAEAFASKWDQITGESRNRSIFENVAQQIEKAESSYNAAKDARVKAESEGKTKVAELLAQSEAQRLETLRETESKANEIYANALYQRRDAYQQYTAAIKELEEANQQAILSSFLGRLSAEEEAELEHNIAKQERLAEEQELMQQYYDWQLESQESLLSFGLEAANTLKDGLASGLASVITDGEKLGDVFKNLGKQILNMFLQWIIGRQLAAVFSKLANKLALAETKSIAAASAAAWQPAAALAEAAVPGSIARGEALAAAVAGSAVAGGIGGLTGDSGSLGENSFMSGGLDGALGGLNTGGLQAASGSALAGGVNTSLGSGGNNIISVTTNNYGNIQNGWDADQLLDGMSGSVLSAIRSS